MAIVSSILLVAVSFIGFAVISYFMVKTAFPKIENDEWEERYIQMKNEAQKLTDARKRAYSMKRQNVLG